MSDVCRECHDPKEGCDPREGHDPGVRHDPKGRDPKETLERRSSKSRLSKQDEVEEVEDDQDHSPSSEASDATIVPTGVDTPVVRTPGGSPESSSPDDRSNLDHQKSVDSDKSSPTQGNPKAKLLVRSKAVCDDTSPPPEDPSSAATLSTTSTTTTLSTSNSASVSPIPSTMATLAVSPTPLRRHRLEKDSSQGSMSDNSNSPMLSRDSSMEYYTDSTGTDLEGFIKMTLNKNRNDRMTLLELETKMTKFIKDSKQQYYKFHQMSSYHRMLVHRVAAFFGLDHNVDQSGKCVVVNRTTNTRIPDFRFNDHISDEMTDDQPKKLLKRDDRLLGGSLDEGRSPERRGLGNKSKSLEERKANYENVKNRIFSDASGRTYSDNPQDIGVTEGPMASGSNPSIHKSSLNTSKEDAHWSRWSSADSSGYSTDNSLKITKASSFPSYVLSRTSSTSSARLSKTDSLSSGISGLSSPMTRPATIPSSPPSEQLSESSGSNQSATSPAHLHSQPGDAHSPGPLAPSFYDEKGQPLAIWVATSTGMIPPGSLIINKETCQPYMNSDGTPLRWTAESQEHTGYPAAPQVPSVQYPQHGGAPSQQQQQQHVMPGHQGEMYSAGQSSAHPPSSHQGEVYSAGQSSAHPPSSHQGEVYTAGQSSAHPPSSHFNGQQVNQQLVPPGVQTYQQQLESSGSSELSHRVGQLTLSPQHSTESLPPEPPAGLTGQQVYSNVQQGNVPQQEAPQGYSQVAPQQVPYIVPNTSTCNPQIRIMYQSNMPYQRPPAPGQGQIEVQGQGQVLSQPGQGQPANGQYAVPQSAYQSSPFSQLTVHSVETYHQQQGYQQISSQTGGAYAGDLQAGAGGQQAGSSGPVQQQSEGPANQINYSQYVGGGGDPGVAQAPPYVQVPGGYIPPGAGTAAAAHVMAFQGANNQASHPVGQGQGHYPASQPSATYRSKSPPSHAPAPHGPSGLPTVSIGQPMPNLAMNPPQYVSFTYPGQQPQNTAVAAAAAQTAPHHPQPQAMGMVPRHQAPSQVWNHLSQGMAGSQAPTQGYPIMRQPALQMGENRFIGQPLQQVPRPQLQPLFSAPGRPRVPTPTGGPNQCAGTASKSGKGRKSWAKGGRDSALSPQSSVESTESSEELSGGVALEVYGFSPHITSGELEPQLSDLIALGARIDIICDDDDASSITQNSLIADRTVVAVFESEYAANQAQSCYKPNHFKLRPLAARNFESSDLATISEHAS